MTEPRININQLDTSYKNLNFQIDFFRKEVIKEEALSRMLNINSIKSEHLDGSPELIRWWFKDLGKALEMMAKVRFDITHRLICLEKNALLIQVGDLNAKV